MAYCGPHGIPYATFLDWDELSRDAAVAWAAREASKCGACGEIRTEWLDKNGIALRVPPKLLAPVYCPSCDLLEMYQSQEHQPGQHPAFMPREVAARINREATERERLEQEELAEPSAASRQTSP